jgi:hypothetical protein
MESARVRGFRARLSDIPVRRRTPLLACRMGSADPEVLELARHKQALAEGREDN